MRDQNPTKDLQRAELARRTGANLETVRYYEKVGLLPPRTKTASGYRSYDRAHERRLSFVLRTRELGISLEKIQRRRTGPTLRGSEPPGGNSPSGRACGQRSPI